MEDGPSKTMLGAEQKAELQSWLHRVDRNIRWKIIVSSVPFTKNWQHNSDTWRAYLWERSKILEDMWAVKGAGVVILSGDRHEFAATRCVSLEKGKKEKETAIQHRPSALLHTKSLPYTLPSPFSCQVSSSLTWYSFLGLPHRQALLTQKKPQYTSSPCLL